MSRSLRRRLGAAATAALLLGTFAFAAPAGASGGGKGNLPRAVTLAGLLTHLTAFQVIASLNGGNRGSGLPGYDRSADYVAKLMTLAGYNVTRQPFDFNYCEGTGSSFAQNAPEQVTYVDQEDYDLMECSGNGTATGTVVPVDVQPVTPNTSTSGCEATDFVGVAGNIALLQRGTCSFGIKVANAEAAGAIGAIVMNAGDTAAPDRNDLFPGTLGTPVGIPAVSVSFGQGVEFVNTPGLNVTITAQTIAEIRRTSNVIAETKTGDPNNVVMAGAHLDSEPDTAGINDNGTGSAGILETALQVARLKIKPTNKLRFAWWGAEESNLVGSTYYVANLTPEQRAQIRLYLNFDMIGSPNYTFGVYDGDDSAAEGSGPGPAGSAEIEQTFQDFFASRGEETDPSDFTGRSDYGPFIAAGVGIPSGGLFTGAEVTKTEEDVAKWGGVAGAQYDPCYHEPCDSLTPERNGADAELYRQLRREYRLFGNVNTYALDVNADAIATAVQKYAADVSSIPPRPAPATARVAAAPAAGQTSHGDWIG